MREECISRMESKNAIKLARRVMRTVRQAISPRPYLQARRARLEFFHQYNAYTESAASVRSLAPTKKEIFAIYGENTSAMHYEPHYTYHCAWACRMLARSRPVEHVDISSSLAFAAMASAWVPIRHYDFRAPGIELSDLIPGTADLTRLPFGNNSIASLSCMHVIEHVGLGRYGDPIDALGDHRAAAELARVLKPGGQLLFVAPVGRRRINFNAHRVYNHADVMALFPGLQLMSHALIPDKYAGGWVDAAPPELIDSQEWGCGCFLFGKNT